MSGGRFERWRESARRMLRGRRMRQPVGIALSGGGTLGAAHVGVLRALEESGVPVERISGTSIGAVAGALYAFATPIDEIERIALDMRWLSISSFSPSRLGLLANRRLGDILEAAIGQPRFEDATIPLAVVTADISTGERVVLDSGEVIPAVLASACVPGIFQPVEHEGRLLVDGGIVENLPTSVLRPMGARTVIGVDLNTGRRYETPGDVIEVILNATDIAINNATRLQVGAGIDLPITPRLQSYSRFRSGRGERLIEEGYEAAHAALAGWQGLAPPAHQASETAIEETQSPSKE